MSKVRLEKVHLVQQLMVRMRMSTAIAFLVGEQKGANWADDVAIGMLYGECKKRVEKAAQDER